MNKENYIKVITYVNTLVNCCNYNNSIAILCVIWYMSQNEYVFLNAKRNLFVEWYLLVSLDKERTFNIVLLQNQGYIF